MAYCVDVDSFVKCVEYWKRLLGRTSLLKFGGVFASLHDLQLPIKLVTSLCMLGHQNDWSKEFKVLKIPRWPENR